MEPRSQDISFDPALTTGDLFGLVYGVTDSLSHRSSHLTEAVALMLKSFLSNRKTELPQVIFPPLEHEYHVTVTHQRDKELEDYPTSHFTLDIYNKATKTYTYILSAEAFVIPGVHYPRVMFYYEEAAALLQPNT